jgi:hypothetical protein
MRYFQRPTDAITRAGHPQGNGFRHPEPAGKTKSLTLSHHQTIMDEKQDFGEGKKHPEYSCQDFNFVMAR